MVKEREMKLLKYLNDHIGEELTARKMFEDLRAIYGHKSGFKSPYSLAKVLMRFRQPTRKENGTNIYLI